MVGQDALADHFSGGICQLEIATEVDVFDIDVEPFSNGIGIDFDCFGIGKGLWSFLMDVGDRGHLHRLMETLVGQGDAIVDGLNDRFSQGEGHCGLHIGELGTCRGQHLLGHGLAPG